MMATPSPIKLPTFSISPNRWRRRCRNHLHRIRSRRRAAAAPQFRTIDGSSDVGFDEIEREARRVLCQRRVGRRRADGLFPAQTSAAVDSAFNALAQTVLVQNARTLEDLVREMLRPMLKTWLDDNLPGMVERLVRAEIERVSRGRAG